MIEVSFWTWFIIAAALIAMEIMTPIYYFLWLGIPAAAVGVIVWLFPGLDATWQLLLFSVLATTSVMGLRAYLRKYQPEQEESQLNKRAEQHVGRILTLDEDIVNGEAKIRVDGITWKIVGPNCKTGTNVRVVSIYQKSILVVEQVPENEINT